MRDIHLQDHHFQALPERALYWPAHSTLLLADLHLGKADTFRHYGIGIPQSVQWADLQRLQQVVMRFQPQCCVVLGDFVHGRLVDAATADAWNALVAACAPTEFVLVAGNHDRALNRGQLHLHGIVDELEIDNVYLTHEPLAAHALRGGGMNIHGHIHAGLRVGKGQRKLPALAWQPPYLLLPAFSEFTAGVDVARNSAAIWVFVEDGDGVLQAR